MVETESKYPVTLVRYLCLLIRLVTGGVFIVSSMSKLPMQSRFVEVVQSFQLLPGPLTVAYGLVLPWVELLVGCYLVLGILVKPGAIITILMCISFLIANISSVIRGEYYCPGCFGELFALSVTQAITIDILIIIGAAVLLLVTKKIELLSFDSWFREKYGSRKS
jgi:putative oxidoreductase